MAPEPAGHPGKDFDPIAADYRFFEEHSTEARAHAAAFLATFRAFLPHDGPGRLLDFGCGSGTFTELVLEQAGWDPDSLELVLVEPAASVRALAEERLRRFSTTQPLVAAALPDGLSGRCGAVMANHVLYYVADLPGTIDRLLAAVTPGGVLAASMAPRTNPLIRIWNAGFRAIGRPVPHHTSEDLTRVLDAAGLEHRTDQVVSRLGFTDTAEHRHHILRFLLAEHLGRMPMEPLMAELDRYRVRGRIEMPLVNDHYTVPVGTSAVGGSGQGG